MEPLSQHPYRARRGAPGCAVCGFIRSNEAAHGHSCVGKILRHEDGRTAHCYECGKIYDWSDIPATVRRAR